LEPAGQQAEGEVETVVTGSGGELGGVAPGLREAAGQGGEPAPQLIAADHPAVLPPALPLRDQGGLCRVGVDVEQQRVDGPRGRLRLDAPGERDGEHSLTHPQRIQVGRGGGEGRRGDTGVTQVLVAQLDADAGDLLPPGCGVRLGQVDLGAQPADKQLVQVRLVDHVGVERRRSRRQRGRQAPHRQGFVPLRFHDAECGGGDGRDRDRLLATAGGSAPGRARLRASAELVPGRAPLLRSR
jgi:hypothetical protein